MTTVLWKTIVSFVFNNLNVFLHTIMLLLLLLLLYKFVMCTMVDRKVESEAQNLGVQFQNPDPVDLKIAPVNLEIEGLEEY